MRVLVTGGAGFIGSHLVDKLIQEGHSVFIVDNLSTGRVENINPASRFYEIDIRDYDALLAVFKKERPDAVFHLAAQIDVLKSEADPEEDILINVIGARNVLSLAIDMGVERFLFSSTGGALYGDTPHLPTPEIHPTNPLSTYGKNKLFFEQLLEFHARGSAMNVTIFRFSNVYGPRQNSNQEGGVVAIFINALLNNETPAIYGDGEQTRDFLYVKDAADAMVRALHHPSGALREHATFNLGTEEETSINQLFEAIAEELEKDIEVRYEDSRAEEVIRSVLSSERFRHTFGFTPRHDLASGIKETVRWFTRDEEGDSGDTI